MITGTITTTVEEFQAWLRKHRACEEGRAWAREAGITCIAEAWAKLEEPDWMAWLGNAIEFAWPSGPLTIWAFEESDRAMRHAAAAMEAAGLTEQAAQLRALPQIDSESAAGSAAESAARSARSAARSAASAARSAARSAAWSAGSAASWSAEKKHACDRLRALIPSITEEVPHDD